MKHYDHYQQKEVKSMRSVYKKEDVEELLDSDEISPEEAAFMIGYSD